MTPLDAAKMCKAAYSRKPDIGQEDSAARAIVSGQCLAFRGSDDLESWLHDLDADPDPIPSFGQIHSGFWEAYEEVRHAVLDLKPKVISGHSLGAALALLAAADLCLSGEPPLLVYCFEPPRVAADSVLASILKDVPLTLYRNGLDIVPTVPWGFGYRHPVPLTRIGKPSLPIPNVQDHEIGAVIAALQ